MTIARFAYATFFFVLGLGVGALWSPLGGFSQMPPDSRSVSDMQSEDQKLVAKMVEMGGKEIEEFVKQFKDMTIRIKKYPFDACASPDGRFVIRLFGSDETIASDLRYPERGGAMKELDRHYSFTCGNLSWSCDFGRSVDDPNNINNVVFACDVKGEQKFSYVDRDGDGLWDWFTDYTQKSPKFYKREGLYWKESITETPKQPDPELPSTETETKSDFPE